MAWPIFGGARRPLRSPEASWTSTSWKGRFRIAAEFADAVDGRHVRIAQVVEQHRHESGFVQGHGSVTSYVAGTAGDQNEWTRTHVANLRSRRRMKPSGRTSRTSLHASSL